MIYHFPLRIFGRVANTVVLCTKPGLNRQSDQGIVNIAEHHQGNVIMHQQRSNNHDKRSCRSVTLEHMYIEESFSPQVINTKAICTAFCMLLTQSNSIEDQSNFNVFSITTVLRHFPSLTATCASG